MFCPEINLLITQKKASAKTGDVIKRSEIASFELFALIISPAKTAPRNVLPTSPIKTFEGCQLYLINPNKTPTSSNMSVENFIEQ